MERADGSSKRSDRLQTIVALAGTGACLVDIGTDHGWVPLEAVRQGRFQRAIGVDLREAPLAAARKRLRNRPERDRVEFRLGKGLQPVAPEEAEVLTLAGLGAATMLAILDSVPAVTRCLVTQPNRELPRLRETLGRKGWCIEDEGLAMQGSRYFPTVRWVRGSVAMNPADLWWGPVLRRRGGPRDQDYRRRLMARIEFISAKDPASCEARVLPELKRAWADEERFSNPQVESFRLDKSGRPWGDTSE